MATSQPDPFFPYASQTRNADHFEASVMEGRSLTNQCKAELAHIAETASKQPLETRQKLHSVHTLLWRSRVNSLSQSM